MHSFDWCRRRHKPRFTATILGMHLVHFLSGNKTGVGLLAWAAALLAVVSLRAFLVFGETLRSERLGHAFVHQLRSIVFEHLGNT